MNYPKSGGGKILPSADVLNLEMPFEKLESFSPDVSGQESAPNAFEGAESVVLSPVSSPCDGRDEAKLQSAAEIGGTSGKVRVLAGDISSPATGAALLESAERHFGGLDKFDSGTRWPSFTIQGGGR